MATRMVLGNTKVPFHILHNRIVQKCNGINNTSKVAAYNIVFKKRECGFFGFDLKGEEGVVAVDKGERASGGVFVEKADKKTGLVNGYFAKDQTRVVKVASQRRVDDDDDEELDDELDGFDEDEWDDEDEYVDDDFVEEEDEDDDDFQARKRK
ncbi:uncharacterized protein LOC115956596 [Quercus lobata]|uniref:uncharacterized protein LOC115956596 n=1 Tax=Quercus lobata TaxID=97700 RepID=UPI00124816A1|nr:uncharacterized protein LOC115956596 [Quercus lobata]